jgi:UDP-N-acetyl-2-amino-2-deoxyglucuronate dehydrogenase
VSGTTFNHPANKPEKVRTAIVGCGKVGHTHAKALSALPESDFVAVCGSNAARTRAFADQYRVAAYTDVQEMIAGAKVEAAVICTPHPLHAKSSVLAAQAGVHVLVEKPLAASLQDCDAMLAAAQSTGVKLGVVCQRRLYEPVQRTWAAIQAGKIGRPILGEVVTLSWRDEPYYRSDAWRGTWGGEGGGILVNQSPHQIDLLQWFMGPVDELTGYWDNFNHPYIEVEDTAVAILRFQNGALGSIVVSNSQKPGLYGKVHVHGERGASVGVQTDGGAMFIAGMLGVAEPPVNDLWTVPGEEAMLAQWQAEDRAMFERINPATHYHRLLDQDFLRAILEDRAPLVPGIEGRRVVEIFTAVYRSQRDGRPVKFPLDAEQGSEQFDGRLAQDR